MSSKLEQRFSVATLPSLLSEYGHTPEEALPPHSKQLSTQESDAKLVASKTKRQKSPKSKPRRSPLPQHHDHIVIYRHGRRSSEKERLEWVADTWDQAKAEILQERHELLQRKLQLQHQLLRAQEKRAKLRRETEEEALREKRQEEKRSRHEKISALEGQCKEALASDRKSKRRSRSSSETENQHGGVDSTDDGQTSSSSVGVGRRERTKSHAGYMPSDAYAPSSGEGPENDLAEEEEEEEEEVGASSREAVTPADLGSVPWHHAQLYRMYGRNADYYIHPKVQVEKKKVVHPTLKRQKGHMGAGHIWTTLRSDSTKKLLRTDRRFPKELKEAFGAHVRDGITKHKKPVFRNFTDTEDVPDLPRLLDQSLLRRIRVLRHKTELMYRSSQTNHDRTKILLFNSPLPDLKEGDQGIGRYLASWDFDNLSDTTEASYMRWLKKDRTQDQDLSDSLNDTDLKVLGGGSGEQEDEALPKTREVGTVGREDLENKEEEGDENDEDQGEMEGTEKSLAAVIPGGPRMWHPRSVLSPLDSEMNESLHDIWHQVMTRQRPRREPRYHFLTEAEARTPGDILSKLGLEPDRIDRGRTDLLPQLDTKRGSQQGRRSLPTSVKAMSAPRAALRHSSDQQDVRSESALQQTYLFPRQASRYESRWQPLSMQALVEYKEQLEAEGAGDFSQGRPAMWRTREATTATE